MTSISRAIGLLRNLAEQGGTASISELARVSGIPIGSAHRMLAELESCGLIEQDSADRRYRLGYGLVVLAQVALRSSSAYRDFSPYLSELRDQWNEGCYVGALINDQVVCLQTVEFTSSHRVYFYHHPGQSMPVYCSAAGKVMLAYQRADTIQRILAKVAFKAFTENTITDPIKFLEHLRAIREQGYTLCQDELEIGVSAVAVPVKDIMGEVKYCLSMVCPSARLAVHLQNGLVDSLKNMSRRISSCLM